MQDANPNDPGTIKATQMVELRRAAGLSQQALAERVRCSVSLVALFERGYAPTRSVTLVRVLAVLAAESGGQAPPVARAERGANAPGVGAERRSRTHKDERPASQPGAPSTVDCGDHRVRA